MVERPAVLPFPCPTPPPNHTSPATEQRGFGTLNPKPLNRGFRGFGLQGAARFELPLPAGLFGAWALGPLRASSWGFGLRDLRVLELQRHMGVSENGGS